MYSALELIPRDSTTSPALQAAAFLRCLALFLIALTATSWGVRTFGPQAPVPQVSDKLAAFAALGDDVNVLFFGSSKTFSGVIPQLFDEVAQSEGMPVRSFNAGIDGMRFPELAWYCEQFLARRPAGLKWVFLELGALRTITPAAYQGSRRTTIWRDLPRTWQMIQAVRTINPDRTDLLHEQWTLGLERAVNLGEGAEWCDRALFPPPPPTGRNLIRASERGYVPIPFPMPARERTELARSVAAMAGSQTQPLDPISENVLLSLATRIREAGVTPIFLIAPNPRRSVRGFENLAGDKPIVWDFERPDLHPELYAPENRFDLAHLNHLGAQAWTTLLARQFAASFGVGSSR